MHGTTQRSLFSVRFLRIHGTYVRARHFGYVSNDTNINCLQQKQQEKIAGKNILITAISNKRSFFSLSPYRVTPSIFSTDLHNGRTTCIHITHTHTHTAVASERTGTHVSNSWRDRARSRMRRQKESARASSWTKFLVFLVQSTTHRTCHEENAKRLHRKMILRLLP